MDKSIRAELSKMSEHDKSRLLQCVFCHLDPMKCGADEKDEDSKGMCKKYIGTVLFEPKRKEEKS